MQIFLSPTAMTGPVFKRTVGLLGIHGETTTGTQGAIVTVPRLEAIIAATVGLEGVVHMPNVGILTIGAKSVMLPTGQPQHKTVTPRAFKGAGVIPKEHRHIVPVVATRDID